MPHNKQLLLLIERFWKVKQAAPNMLEQRLNKQTYMPKNEEETPCYGLHGFLQNVYDAPCRYVDCLNPLVFRVVDSSWA